MSVNGLNTARRDCASVGWSAHEAAQCTFVYERLGKRFSSVLGQLADGLGQSIPMACQDWANAKAAYRFLSNPRVSEANILSGHLSSTKTRFAHHHGPVLVLHDTTEFSYKRDNSEAIGLTHLVSSGARVDGRLREHAVCGILMHSSLVVTTEGLPLGLAAIKFWSRKEFKGQSTLRTKINPTRIPIEQKESMRWVSCLNQSTQLLGDPQRCVHVGDRESDIYELFCAAQDAGTHFVFRTCADRLAGDGENRVSDFMSEVRCRGLHKVHVRDRQGNPSVALLELRYLKIRLRPPVDKRKRYPDLTLTVLHATERGVPVGRDAIEWKLITDLPVTSKAEALEKLQWYALRWKIEVFHKILKSGCKAEESKLRTG